ncbi:peptide transporter-like protein PTR2 [Sporormia fimetaria CBS 119925]|uniref:Peptide transporter-like protein PTR2 n=1 Tax=Sporormia fimetaria CBS 119925 TaxID=1340428 RepID=A0A6A6V2K7_9PLEO|nr:peptide transporter-like protein PTR2 [Sporormia fimetaria CBS 119925]
MTSLWRTMKTGVNRSYTTVAQSEDANIVVRDSESNRPHEVYGEREADSSSSCSDDLMPNHHASLERVADIPPWGAFLIAVVELCERFAYYGLSGPFQNYMANSYKDANGLPGAIGLKQSGATFLSNLFQFWCYITPIVGAIVADQYLGKYATIKCFSLVYMVGIGVLFVTSLPISIEHGGAFPGLLVAMFIIGLGTGGIKSNVSPLIAEQVRSTKPFVKVLKSGRPVLVDPELTVQRIYMIFYMCINVGSVSAVATTILERHVGFWSAYLLPLMTFCLGFLVLVSGKGRYVLRPPQGGVIGNCFKALWMAARNGFDLDQAKPSVLGGRGKRQAVTWDDAFVEELRTALEACKVFLFFPIYWVTYSQMMNNFVSQAGQMELHGLPNDMLPNIDPIAIILLIPIMDRFIYPFIRTRLHMAFTPTTRIALGFWLASSAMAYAAILQARIYASQPCYNAPLNCPKGLVTAGKYVPNRIHAAWQAPAYVLVALSEILASITGLELAYAKAPQNMKSFIMSLFLLTSAFGSALGMLLAPLAKDPRLVWLYSGLALTALIAGIAFYRMFRETGGRPHRKLADSLEDDTNEAEEYELGSRTTLAVGQSGALARSA